MHAWWPACILTATAGETLISEPGRGELLFFREMKNKMETVLLKATDERQNEHRERQNCCQAPVETKRTLINILTFDFSLNKVLNKKEWEKNNLEHLKKTAQAHNGLIM